MEKFYQNTFLFISRYKKNLLPFFKHLQWAKQYQIERLDTVLIHMGINANTLSDSHHHIIIGFDIYQHANTKEYILRIHTESTNDTHPIDMELCRLYMGQRIQLHYTSEERTKLFYLNTDSSNTYLPMRFKVELYVNECYDINYFVNLTALQKFLVSIFPQLQLNVFDSYKAVRSKVNRYLKSMNANNWCHIASYQMKSIN